MKKLSLNFLLLIILVTITTKSNAQTFHMNALDAYWEMIEPLKKGDSLSQETWKKFLSLEPNEIYIKNQGFDKDYLERLRKSIEVVYMPQKAEILKKRVLAIEKDPSSSWLTYKVYVYKTHEKELKDFQQKLVSSDYLSQIYKNSFSWLPTYLQKKDDNVNIYLLGIENDAIAGSGTVIATLWNLYNADKIQTGALLGHEMHHVLRKPFHFKVEKQDEGLMYFLNVVLNEGSADMIDKPSNIANQNTLPYGLGLTDFLIPQADSIVKQANKNIEEMQKSNGELFKTEKDYRNLVKWSSGHNPGYFMADIIVRNGYRNQLLKNIQNPFEFIYLYNKAAHKDSKNPPAFTDESIKYIKMMEKKYWLTKSI
ncbi:hypothetical protein LNQ49_06790 [Flavobacterium sp. F-65]|jgi:hypothetical protein|uniref:Peptidase family M48 n=1 Tax=Flavobacterium pisciphilum TaxID=2893755 RepID=A0ABS8MRB6_9FLAO|nr:DUF5700 domain-containing putative Zn-dependent protease [Flavobacterium sp. F-65]MCC9071299.1 hypothetical protein [Flavobacterium sp. F-65]